MPTPRTSTTSQHRDLDLEVISGAWPSDVAGDVLFSAPMMSGRLPYGIFDLGCIIRLSLEPGTRGAASDHLAWRVHPIETPSKRIHDAAGHAFSPSAVGYRSPFGPPNSSNTAPLVWGDRLFTTWDAGRPVELHPATLDFVAEVGRIDSWGASALFGDTVLPTLLTSAHPVADPERHGLWTTRLEPVLSSGFALAPSVVWWDGAGTDVRVWPLDGIEFQGSTHTVSQTRDWLVVCDSGNFRADMGEILGGERTVTTDTDAPVWLVRKDELLARPSGTPVEPVRLRVAPPCGHFYARYDDTDGISVLWEGMDLLDLGLYLRADDVDLHGNPIDPASVGLYNMAMAPQTICELVVDPASGRIVERATFREDWAMNLQLSTFDAGTGAGPGPSWHHVDYQGCRPGRITERAARLYDGRFDRSVLADETPGHLVTFERGSLAVRSSWEYRDTSDLITSPAFVPRTRRGDAAPDTTAGDDGYVVQPVLSDDGLRIELFDAADVGAGPVAVLRGTRRECVPLLLHSAWTPGHDHLVDAERVRFADELSEARLAGLDDEQRRLVRDVADALDAELDGARAPHPPR